MGGERRVAMTLGDGVHVRRVPSGDGVALHVLLWRDPPAIVDAVRRANLNTSTFNDHDINWTHMRQTLFFTSVGIVLLVGDVGD